MPKTKAEILASKKLKMADPGYYLEYHLDEAGHLCPAKCHTVICIGEEATAKYVHGINPLFGEWSTLNWNCAPSRKFMEKQDRIMQARPGTFCVAKFQYYPNWAAFIAQTQFSVPQITTQIKAPNDTFSP